LASALGLLATTAPATIIRYFPDPIVDTDWHNAPLASWDPMGTDSEAGDGSGLYPGTYAAATYGCSGTMCLSVGTPDGLDFYDGADPDPAPRLAVGNTIGPSHTDWTDTDSGYAAYIDNSGYTWGQPFYIGYRIEAGGTDYYYGYARMSGDYVSGEPAQMRFTVTEWAYENAVNTGITIQPIPEPGMLALLFLGVVALAGRRLFRLRRG